MCWIEMVKVQGSQFKVATLCMCCIELELLSDSTDAVGRLYNFRTTTRKLKQEMSESLAAAKEISCCCIFFLNLREFACFKKVRKKQSDSGWLHVDDTHWFVRICSEASRLVACKGYI